MGFEPATFQAQGTEPTTEPLRPTMYANIHVDCYKSPCMMPVFCVEPILPILHRFLGMTFPLIQVAA